MSRTQTWGCFRTTSTPGTNAVPGLMGAREPDLLTAWACAPTGFGPTQVPPSKRWSRQEPGAAGSQAPPAKRRERAGFPGKWEKVHLAGFQDVSSRS